MDRLKKFFKDNKTKKNFKKAGPGRRLADTASNDSAFQSSTGNSAARMQYTSSKSAAATAERIATADVAAQAAYRRMNLGSKQETATQRNIRLKAMKELEEERHQAVDFTSKGVKVSGDEVALGNHIAEESNLEHCSAIKDVFFICELFGENVKLTRSEMQEQLEEFLRAQFNEDPVVASSLMIFSLNNEKRQLASETLQKYLRNLIEHPDEPKYRRIRMSNKAFQERVLSVKGGLEFLLACGFERVSEKMTDTSTAEEFLIINEERSSDVGSLLQALEVLETGEPVPLKLYRDPLVFTTNRCEKVMTADLSPEFFQLSAAEVKKEQTAKTMEAEKLLTLRTREMRLRDETLHHCAYKYTLIRIKFPDNYYLQGIFACHEKLAVVREFICEHLAENELPIFSLRDPINGKVLSDDTKTLEELNFVPAVVLNFEWDSEVLASYSASGIQIADSILKKWPAFAALTAQESWETCTLAKKTLSEAAYNA